MKKIRNIAFIVSDVPEAAAAASVLRKRYGDVPAKDADVIVALGGDGLMLHSLHQHIDDPTPIYGMHRGSVGFLMNEFAVEGLLERLAVARVNILHPLRMQATDNSGKLHEALAINEVSIFRRSHQAAKLRILIDDSEKMPELICDGVLLATPAGSTAYNLSAHGPIIPINANLLALTPISPFRPRRWRGALLANSAKVEIEVLEPAKRPVSAVADNKEFRDIKKVKIWQDETRSLHLMFDPGHSLDERILSEQFSY
jgi:NAD+ kinase